MAARPGPLSDEAIEDRRRERHDMLDSTARAWGPRAVSDPNARRPRTFQCRDALWENLEQIAGELECTVDYLVNDAVKLYIRQRLTRHPQPETEAVASAPPFAVGGPSYPLT